MNPKRLNILTATALALVIALAAGPVPAMERPEMEGRGDIMSSVSFLGAEVAWVPAGEVERFALRVAGPATDLEERFSGGAPAVFSLFDERGEARPDGVYKWELREELSAVNSRVRDTANGRDLEVHDSNDRVEFSGRVQWGVFTIVNGALVDSSLIEHDSVRPPKDEKDSE